MTNHDPTISRSVFSYAEDEVCADRPLLIAGAGPSWDEFDWSSLPDDGSFDIFALNHTITELYPRKCVWWVSNDHDRTFQSRHVSRVVPPRLAGYAPWRTITQQIFVPGPVGDINFVDHKGVPREPLAWRLPLPSGSEVAYYVAGEHMRGRPEYVRNGDTVLELALEVAGLWGYRPTVLVGCDLSLSPEGEYYAEAFRWKGTPRRCGETTLARRRESVARHRMRWDTDIYLVSELWPDPPFRRVSPESGLRILRGEGAWSRA